MIALRTYAEMRRFFMTRRCGSCKLVLHQILEETRDSISNDDNDMAEKFARKVIC